MPHLYDFQFFPLIQKRDHNAVGVKNNQFGSCHVVHLPEHVKTVSDLCRYAVSNHLDQRHVLIFRTSFLHLTDHQSEINRKSIALPRYICNFFLNGKQLKNTVKTVEQKSCCSYQSLFHNHDHIFLICQ